MTRENAARALPIIQAYAEGRPVQVNITGEWVDVTDDFDLSFSGSLERYRITPERKMVPIGADDVPPGSVIRSRTHCDSSSWSLVLAVSDNGIKFGSQMESHAVRTLSYFELAQNCEISRDGGKTWHKCEKEAKE